MKLGQDVNQCKWWEFFDSKYLNACWLKRNSSEQYMKNQPFFKFDHEMRSKVYECKQWSSNGLSTVNFSDTPVSFTCFQMLNRQTENITQGKQLETVVFKDFPINDHTSKVECSGSNWMVSYCLLIASSLCYQLSASMVNTWAFAIHTLHSSYRHHHAFIWFESPYCCQWQPHLFNMLPGFLEAHSLTAHTLLTSGWLMIKSSKWEFLWRSSPRRVLTEN